MVLSECQQTEAECMFLLFDHGVLTKHEIQIYMEEYLHHVDLEMYVYISWMLNRWVFLRKHPLHLPTRIKTESYRYIHLANLINSNRP